MFAVGLDVDTLVSTELPNIIFFKFNAQENLILEREKILLYAGNFWLNSPLVLFTFGKICLNKYNFLFTEQSAGNLSFSTKATASTVNIYNIYSSLPKISDHVPLHKTNLTDDEFGYFLAGLIEGGGWFGQKELHIIFSERDTSLAYLIKKRIGYGNVYSINNKKAVRYVCKHKLGMYIILSLINGKLVSKFKYEQMIKHNYNIYFNINILPPTNIVSLDNYWLAGFTQADGCFSY